MIKEVQALIGQIETFLSDKEGFSTETSSKNCVIKVKNASGTENQYDGYELLLYTLAVRKLGDDIELNINSTDDGKIFAINTKANMDIRQYMTDVNAELCTYDDEPVQSILVCDQTGDSPQPYCVLTIFKNGNWLRQDLTMAELLYAATHELKIEKQDGAYVYTKLRELADRILKEIQEKE
jgi:hypothetical protein